jgi:WD40 repeat protein
VLRTWHYDGGNNKFVLQHTLSGHAGEITGLTTISPGGNGTAGRSPPILWSGSTDRSIRLWDLTTENCQFLITSESGATTDGSGGAPTPNAGGSSTAQGQGQGQGHTEAITSLLALESPAGNFVLSSSLDGSVKAWNGSNGTCMASEMHGEGVVSMALATDPKGNPLLLLGLQEGIIMCLSVLQTPTTPAYSFLFALMPRYTIGHAGPVKSIEAGPASTFYTGGNDGKLLIFQITADLGL